MKKPFILCMALILTSCGTIGVGSNHKTNVYNNSSNTISVKSDTGIYKIKPDESIILTSPKSQSLYCPSKIKIFCGFISP